MRNFTLFPLFILLSTFLSGQITDGLVPTKHSSSTFKATSVLTAFDGTPLPAGQELRLHYVEEERGRQHAKYHQYLDGKRVLGGTVILHASGGGLYGTSGYLGDLPPTLSTTKSGVRPDLARAAHTYFDWAVKSEGLALAGPAERVAFREVVMHANYPERTGAYLLAQGFTLYAPTLGVPIKREIFVAVESGYIITAIDELHTERVIGTGDGFYNQGLSFATDSIAEGEYLLRDLSRGQGVVATDITENYATPTDEDNVWFGDNEYDAAMLDGYVASLDYFDLLEERFNRNSIDGQGAPLVINMNRFDYVNAFWNGVEATIGNGNCASYSPLTTHEIVSHEFTHGLTDYTSDLVYRNESGALNESISDIFGKALEYYSDSDNFNWQIGSALRRNEEARLFRSMENPNVRNHPKFYLGEHWYDGPRDNGGVHFNSGVLNHWFYLLVEGKAGTNEIGEAFDVAGIGMDDAIQLVYHLQTAYLTESSNYPDCYELSQAAAADLWGTADDRFAMMNEAWKAVGLPSSLGPVGDTDVPLEGFIRVTTAGPGLNNVFCDAETIEFILSATSFSNQFIPAGTSVQCEIIVGPFDGLPIEMDTIQIDPFELMNDLYQYDDVTLPTVSFSSTPGVDNYQVGAKLTYSNTSDPTYSLSGFTLLRINRDEVYRASESSGIFSSSLSCGINNDDGYYYNVDITSPSCTQEIDASLRIDFFGNGREASYDYGPMNADGSDVRFNNLYNLIDTTGFGGLNGLLYKVVLERPGQPDSVIHVGDYGRFYVETQREPFYFNFDDADDQEIARKSLSIFPGYQSALSFEGGKITVTDGFSINPEGLSCISYEDYFGADVSPVNTRNTVITTCLDMAQLGDAYFSFDLAQMDDPAYTAEENGFLHAVNVFADGERLNTEIINNAGSAKSTYSFRLPEFFNGQVFIAIASPGTETVIDNIRLTADPISPTFSAGQSPLEITYTNPVGDFAQLIVAGTIPEGSRLRLRDGTGRTVRDAQLSARMRLNVSGLPAGLYFLSATDDRNYRWTGKLVKR